MELDIGKQCELQSCRQLDYCPFLCNLCKKYYCINHRKPDGHECDKIDEVNVVTPIPKELPKLTEKCFQCKKLIPSTPLFICYKCNKGVCMQHRVPNAHKCEWLNQLDMKLKSKKK